WLRMLTKKYKGSAQIAKTAPASFDVFLCHNSSDKPIVKQIGEQLIKHGIQPWLDEWNLIPGRPWQRALEEQINNIKSVAVFVGDSGLGPWTSMELEAFLREFVKRGCPVIPVILPNVKKTPELPVFLNAMHWVDFRLNDPDPLDQLIWGITGEAIPKAAKKSRRK
ncbi:MAG TPA: toll/interleukin-1 receptor domain-containing protein, partial [Pyrinomonadaceae bacterium]|nr:toll/interleukin-1 receptor domain-containing protein [Pyrinomonadaceae bacterium]